ncbi:LysR family transcriptional regulator [Microvirga sp. W0021]|uniref:LysR family transcriptional regulator n=1 Tax=Hohaiivirga grylli TaxID=3133970 RepID=A0ABV0BJ80_9HYPH
MPRENLNDLAAFVLVARERNFTRAAAQIGVSQSALSHTIRGLETRLGVRLLSRTTRNVSLTEIGEKVLDSLGPRIDDINEQLELLWDLKEEIAGNIRISTTDFAINTILWPKLKPVLEQYPDIHLELFDDYALTDIVADRFDAGVRLGEQLQDGMISVRIGPDIRFAVVGSPSYFAKHPKPQTPQDLIDHVCINIRFPTHGNVYAWEFEKDGKELKVRVKGQLTFNRTYQSIEAALEGFGLAHVPLDTVESYIKSGRLISVLEDWFPPWDGHYLYYPSKKNHSKAFKIIIDALRHKS